MDRDWIYLPRISVEYEKGVEKFIQFTQRYEGRSDDEVKFRCPCVTRSIRHGGHMLSS